MSNKRLYISYSGTVQGVGFRFAAERTATTLGLSGWVRNLNDGRVEVLAEGGSDNLNRFMEKIDDIFKEYIKDSDVVWGEATGEFDGFDVRH